MIIKRSMQVYLEYVTIADDISDNDINNDVIMSLHWTWNGCNSSQYFEYQHETRTAIYGI